MGVRRDKNKKLKSGQARSNDQFLNSADQKSNRDKRINGGSPSIPQERNSDSSGERSMLRTSDERNTPHHIPENFNMLVDSVPYLVQATGFEFNGQKRFTVSINGNEEHIFTWDSELRRLAAIDDDAASIPDSLEAAIADKLQSMLK